MLMNSEVKNVPEHKILLMLACMFFLAIPLVIADNEPLNANLNITNIAPTVTAPLIITEPVYTNDTINCSGGNYTDANGEPEAGREYRWYENTILIGSETGQTLNLNGSGYDHFDNFSCSIRVNDSELWSNWTNSSNTITILNSNVTILGTERSPTSADTSEQLNFSVQATDLDLDSLTAYCQPYNGTNPYGSTISASIPDNTMTLVCNISSTITGHNESWHADFWVTDGYMNSSISTTLSISVGAWASNINDSTNHTNLTITITFETAIPTNFTIHYSLDGNASNLNETYSDPTFSTNHTATITINPDETFYYEIQTSTEASGDTETWGPYSTTYSCTESWTCGSWSTCDGGLQNRTCTDSNNCGTTDSRPAINQSCSLGGGGPTGTYLLEEELEIPTPVLLPGEPITCGNGIIDAGETYLNCNKDIPPTIIDYLKCIQAGKDTCVYYDLYARTLFVIITTLIVGIALAWAAGGTTLIERRRKKKR